MAWSRRAAVHLRRSATLLARAAIPAVGAATVFAVCIAPSSVVRCAPLSSGTAESKARQLDEMRDEPHRYSRKQCYEEAAALAQRYADDAGILWRAARAAYDLAELPETPTDQKKKLISEEAMKWINQARSLDRSDGAIFRWSGIILSGAGKYGSTSDYIKNTFVIRDYWTEAATINPKDQTALYLLGRWHFDVASLSWVSRKLAATLFAEPPTATYEEAYEYFARAEAIAPRFYKANTWMLAETAAKLGRKEDAVRWCREALEIDTRTQYDQEAQNGVLALFRCVLQRVCLLGGDA